MAQKISSETFRHRFLDYNRPWLVAQLPNILTPRTLRRSRPFLLAQFSKLLGTVNPDISSDTSGDDKEKQFGPVTLDSASRTMIRLWLAQARRRMRLREVRCGGGCGGVDGVVGGSRRKFRFVLFFSVCVLGCGAVDCPCPQARVRTVFEPAPAAS